MNLDISIPIFPVSEIPQISAGGIISYRIKVRHPIGYMNFMPLG